MSLENRTKFQSNDPKCEGCGTSLDYYEEEGVKTWWQCPKCGNVEGLNEEW